MEVLLWSKDLLFVEYVVEIVWRNAPTYCHHLKALVDEEEAKGHDTWITEKPNEFTWCEELDESSYWNQYDPKVEHKSDH